MRWLSWCTVSVSRVFCSINCSSCSVCSAAWAARCSLTADVRKGTVGTPGGGSLHFVLGCSLHLIDLTRGESQDVDITLKSAE